MQFKLIAAAACLALGSANGASDVPRFCATFGGLTRDDLGRSLRQTRGMFRTSNREVDPNTAQFLDSLDRMGQDYSHNDVYDEIQRMCLDGDVEREMSPRALAARQGDIVKQLVTSLLGSLGTWY